MSYLFDLKGKVAVAFGGNSTLGSAIATAFADYGADVAVVGRNPVTAKKVAEQIIKKGQKAKAFFADVSKTEDIERVATEIEDWSGGWDIVLNAPGKNSSTPFLELEEAEWDDIMAVNLKGLVFTIQTFAKKMIAQKRPGSIINISSVSSGPPLSRVFTYSASKAGVNSVTQYLAREFAPYGIRVNAIIPGFFPAEQNRRILDDSRITAIMEHTPLKRFGIPDELQGAAVFLASEKASSFVTGALIRVDGGFGAMTI